MKPLSCLWTILFSFSLCIHLVSSSSQIFQHDKPPIWERATCELCSVGSNITRIQTLYYHPKVNELFVFLYGGPAEIVVLDADTGDTKRSLIIRPRKIAAPSHNYGIQYVSAHENARTGAIDHLIVMVNDNIQEWYNGKGRMIRIDDNGRVLAQAWEVVLQDSTGMGMIPNVGGPIHSADGKTVYANLLSGAIAAYSTSDGAQLWFVQPKRNFQDVQVGGLAFYENNNRPVLLGGKTEGSGPLDPGPHGGPPQFFMFDALTGETLDAYTHECSYCVGNVRESAQLFVSSAENKIDYVLFNDAFLGNVRFDLNSLDLPLSKNPEYSTNSLDFIKVPVAIASDGESFFGGRDSSNPSHAKYASRSSLRIWNERGPTVTNTPLVSKILLNQDRVYFIHRDYAIGRNLHDGREEVTWKAIGGLSSGALNKDGSMVFLSHDTYLGVVAYSTMQSEPQPSSSNLPTPSPTRMPSRDIQLPTLAPQSPVTNAPAPTPQPIQSSGSSLFFLGKTTTITASLLSFLAAFV